MLQGQVGCIITWGACKAGWDTYIYEKRIKDYKSGSFFLWFGDIISLDRPNIVNRQLHLTGFLTFIY